MGEKPVFSTRAHVFQIDPQTKKNWKPASKTAIPVAFYHDSVRKTYRIISVDGGKPLVNSTITPNMNFTKTSPKFGQWTDIRVATIYGLGFASETELNKFCAQFDDAKAATKAALSESGASSMTRQRSVASPTSSSSSEQSEGNSGMSNGTSSNDVGKSTSLVGKDTSNMEERPTANGAGVAPRKASISGPSGSLEGQLQALKYENDRLKIALATSSSHGKKWEAEMQTLKNNNAKLTTALQESLSHVEEWKKQLRHYKEENGKLKQRVQELEAAQVNASSHTNDTTAALTEEIRGLEKKVEELQSDRNSKEQELSRVSEQLEEMSAIKSESQTLRDRLNVLEEEKSQMTDQLSDTQDRLQVASIAFDMRLQQLTEKHNEVGERLREALNVHQLMEADLK